MNGVRQMIVAGRRRSQHVWALAALGLAGSLLVAYAAPRAVTDAATRWWYTPGAPAGRGASTVLVYLGMALLALAWLGLGPLVASRVWRAPGPPHAREKSPSTASLLVIGGLWLAPLLLAPALYSHDIYSYLAQGTILHLGHNPYHDTPALLARLGHGHVLAAVSPFWRHTPAPYGPLFLKLMSLIVAVTGSHLVAGVLATRALELAGGVLLAVFLPRLARALGTDPARAIWLGMLSPLVTLELVAAGHNDLLMIGLLAAAVTLALEGRPLLGVALCALAATIKVPALAATVFIAVAWARAEPTPSARARFLLNCGLLTLAVLAVVSVVTGLGVSWLSSSVFSSPARVRLAITPATGIGWTVASLLHGVGLSVGSHSVESAFGVLAVLLTATAAVVLLQRVRVATLALYLGAVLWIAAAGGPAAWPWYASWGLVVLAACPGPQRSAGLAVALAAASFLVKPNGILALPLQSAPGVVAAYVLIAGAVWRARRGAGGDRRPGSGADRGATGAASAPIADGTPSPLVRT